MTIPALSTPPAAPSRTTDTPSQFVDHADAWLTYWETVPDELDAWVTAVASLVSGVDFNGTSVTSNTVGTGSKTWTTQTGKLWQIGQFVIVSDSATPANYCYGQVTAYSGSTLTVNVTTIGGSGTKTAWAIGIAPNASSYATQAGAETFTNKTIAFASNTITGTWPIVNGGTGQTTAGAAFTGLLGFTTTATAAGTTTLTNTSTLGQMFTGSTTQTITLPVVSTLALGWPFCVANRSTGTLTVNSSGGNLVASIPAGQTWSIECILTTGTTAASWDAAVAGFTANTGTGSNVLATSPTIANPTITGSVTNTPFAITDAAAFVVNPRNGAIQTITLGANRTPVASGWTNGDAVRLLVDDGTAFTITWTTMAVTWIGGVAPTLQTTGYTSIYLEQVGGVIYGRDDTPSQAGAFTTLSASSTVSGAGFSAYLASPPAIGGTAAAAGSFTTLTASTGMTSTRVTPRVLALSSNLTQPSINTDSYDVVVITSQTNAINTFTTNLSGTPTNGQRLEISITGTASVSLTWGTSFEASTVALPTTTSGTTRLDVHFRWNAATSKWRCVLVA